MKDQIQLSKIDIKIGDKTISLKPEQLRELQKVLDDLFPRPKETEHHYHHYDYWRNYPIYVYPKPVTYPTWTYTSGSIGTAVGSVGYGSGNLQNTTGTCTLALNAA